MASDIEALRAAAQSTEQAFETTLRRHYPRADKWVFYRAEESVKAGTADKWDSEMAANPEICAAHDAFTATLHQYYAARYGATGVLGQHG
jgi:hypothetical protein